jgi:hypothetical protein
MNLREAVCGYDAGYKLKVRGNLIQTGPLVKKEGRQD